MNKNTNNKFYILLYGLFLVLFFLYLFPYNTIKDKLFNVVEQYTGLVVQATDLRPTLAMGLRLNYIRIYHPSLFTTPITIGSMTLRTSFFSLIRGKLGVVIGMEDVYGGNLEGEISRKNKDFIFSLDGADIQLAKIHSIQNLLKSYIPDRLTISGLLGISLDLQISPQNPFQGGKGDFKVRLENLQSTAVSAYGFKIPSLLFTESEFQVTLVDNKIELKNSSLGSIKKDPMSASIKGFMTIKNSIDKSDMEMNIKLNVQRAFRENPTISTLIGLISSFQKSEGIYSLKLIMNNGQLGFPVPGD